MERIEENTVTFLSPSQRLDCLTAIFEHLDIRDLCRCAQVSTSWRNAVNLVIEMRSEIYAFEIRTEENDFLGNMEMYLPEVLLQKLMSVRSVPKLCIIFDSLKYYRRNRPEDTFWRFVPSVLSFDSDRVFSDSLDNIKQQLPRNCGLAFVSSLAIDNYNQPPNDRDLKERNIAAIVIPSLSGIDTSSFFYKTGPNFPGLPEISSPSQVMIEKQKLVLVFGNLENVVKSENFLSKMSYETGIFVESNFGMDFLSVATFGGANFAAECIKSKFGQKDCCTMTQLHSLKSKIMEGETKMAISFISFNHDIPEAVDSVSNMLSSKFERMFPDIHLIKICKDYTFQCFFEKTENVCNVCKSNINDGDNYEFKSDHHYDEVIVILFFKGRKYKIISDRNTFASSE